MGTPKTCLNWIRCGKQEGELEIGSYEKLLEMVLNLL